MLRPLLEEGLDIWEATRVLGLTTKAKEAHLPDALLRELEKDAKFNPLAKRGVASSGPEMIAKSLNAAGVSAKHKDAIVVIGGLLMIVRQGASLNNRLDELIAKTNPPTGKPVTKP